MKIETCGYVCDYVIAIVKVFEDLKVIPIYTYYLTKNYTSSKNVCDKIRGKYAVR